MCASAIPRSQALHDALTAQLKTVNLQALRNEDTLEASKLFRACVEEGIFYLDISQTSPDTLRAVEEIYQLEEGLFGLQEAELLQYDIDRLSPMKLNGFALTCSPNFLKKEAAEQGSSGINPWVAIEGSLQRTKMDFNHTP